MDVGFETDGADFDRSDFYIPADSMYIVCSPRVGEALKAAKLSGLIVEHLTESLVHSDEQPPKPPEPPDWRKWPKRPL